VKRLAIATALRVRVGRVRLGSGVIAAGIVLASALSCAPARAQVNTETLRKRIKTSGYSLIVEGSLTGDTGNTEGVQAGGGLGGGWASGRHLVFLYGRVDYSRFNHTTQVAKTFAHARYVYEIIPGVWGELFAQAQSDQFQRIKLRNLVGVGPRLRLLHADTFDTFLGTAYMLERDVINVAPGTGDQSDYLLARWSTYVTAHWDVDPRVILVSTLYVQPQITDWSNTRVLSETLFTFKITPVLAATIAGTIRYDSAPPSEVKTTDAEIKNSLLVTF
jgi:hypothetical protein